MAKILKKKIIVWFFLSINLLAAFFVGFFVLSIDIVFGIVFGFIISLIFLSIIYFLLGFFKIDSDTQIFKKRISIWLMLTLNLAFSFTIGAIIPLMESKMWIRYSMAFVLLPLLIILNYIILNRYHYYMKHVKQNENEIKKIFQKSDEIEEKTSVPVIKFKGKNYIFTIRSIILFVIGAPILSLLIFLFFDAEMNYWLQEISVKQTAFILSLLGVKAKTIYTPLGNYHWSIFISGRGQIYLHTFCTGIQYIAVFWGVIIFTPHSQDPKTKEDIIWRKTKALIVSTAMFYVVNIIRMVIELYLFHIGYPWEDISYSVAAASSFIAAIILLLMHSWIPEFMISVIYGGILVNRRIKKKKEGVS